MPASTWSKFYGFLMGRPVEEETAAHAEPDSHPQEGTSVTAVSPRIEEVMSTQDATLIYQVQAGMDLCTADHTKLGTIHSVHPPAGQGQDAVIAGTREDNGAAVFVPASAVQEIHGQCVLLKFARAEIDEQGWNQPHPAAGE